MDDNLYHSSLAFFHLIKFSFYTQENPAVTALAYSKDAQFLAAGHQNGLLQLWRSKLILILVIIIHFSA